MSHGLLVISPCHNEAPFVGETIRSVASQTLQPACWIIVDDGSTDGSSEIIQKWAERLAYIQVVHRNPKRDRTLGSGVIEAFYEGLDQIDWHQFGYICKLDADVSLPEDYFQAMVLRMQEDPRLGTCSGKAYYRTSDGYRISEKVGDEVSLGAAKFYRTRCFEQIGGFIPEVMWDGIDCHRCRMLGWRACSWSDVRLQIQHMRAMGSSDRGVLRGRRRHGAGQYFMGTGLIYMSMSALYRMTWPPVITGSLAMLRGYLKAFLMRKPQYPDKAFRRFLRRYQRRCMFRGKVRATKMLDREQASVWDADRPAAPSQRELLS